MNRKKYISPDLEIKRYMLSLILRSSDVDLDMSEDYDEEENEGGGGGVDLPFHPW